jgi:hypothetical protein
VVAVYAYGDKLADIIFFNFDKTNIMIYLQSFLYSIMIFMTFPYVLFPLAPSIANLVSGKTDNSEVSNLFYKIQFTI